MLWLAFDVEGQPMPGGSKKTLGNGAIIEDFSSRENLDRKKGWRSAVAYAATQARLEASVGLIVRHVPIVFVAEFRRLRPAAHFRSDGTIRPAFVDACPTSAPDATKLIRSTEDALTGILWEDDATIVAALPFKRFCRPGEPSGCFVSVFARF